MADLTQLQAWRDALEAARYAGIREIDYDGRKIRYGTDAERHAAIAVVNRQINALTGVAVSVIKVSSSKGL